jgi:hypothetical protein
MLKVDEMVAENVQWAIDSKAGRYVLIARRLMDGWFAAWTCHDSGKRGVNGVVYTSPETALEMTARNLGIADCCPSSG